MEIQQVQILVCVLLDNWHRFVEKQRMVERVSYDSTMKGPTMNFLSEWRNNRSNSPRIQGMIAHVLSNLVFLAAIWFFLYQYSNPDPNPDIFSHFTKIQNYKVHTVIWACLAIAFLGDLSHVDLIIARL